MLVKVIQACLKNSQRTEGLATRPIVRLDINRSHCLQASQVAWSKPQPSWAFVWNFWKCSADSSDGHFVRASNSSNEILSGGLGVLSSKTKLL
mmetsp:Transcript_26698/g.60291  ORF Transcript_26698/g.60291 Transcript_26698/m.60291 type:complete len:93 (+) Transcript_26698:65-343(+)